MIAGRYETPRGETVLVVAVSELGIEGDEVDVEILDADGEVVGYFPGLTRLAATVLAVSKGWRPCRAR